MLLISKRTLMFYRSVGQMSRSLLHGFCVIIWVPFHTHSSSFMECLLLLCIRLKFVSLYYAIRILKFPIPYIMPSLQFRYPFVITCMCKWKTWRFERRNFQNLLLETYDTHDCAANFYVLLRYILVTGRHNVMNHCKR